MRRLLNLIKLRRLWKILVTTPCPDCINGFKFIDRGTHYGHFRLCTLCRGTGRIE